MILREADLEFALAALRLKLIQPELLDRAMSARQAATLRETLLASGALTEDQARAADEAVRVAGRYRLGAEIGRGGLGRVVEAHDLELDRDVAVKLVLEDLPKALKDRFVREARLTARLEHPNIVPVHGLVSRDAGAPMLGMKRIQGQDLSCLIRNLARGDSAATSAWSRPQLLSMFQHICLGVAFAHSKGIIHRDLKPANVMIGEFGEVLVVDWGLAKEKGSVAGARLELDLPVVISSTDVTAMPRGADGAPAKTMEGDVVGTPAYMSPEQAAGRQNEVDERSDIWALGAILYEILTFHPPIEGRTILEVLERARSGVVRAPSSLVASIPPDLDAICRKAMAPRRQDRFQTAIELHREIQLFLEGVKERERNHRLAEEAVGKAKAAMERRVRLQGEAEVAAGEAAKAEKASNPWDTDKSVLWGAQDRVKALEREIVEAFSDADAGLTVALGHERGHAEARRLKADLFWGKLTEAEERGDRKEMLLNRRVVEQFNDGPFDALLKGEGTLTVRTRVYACHCLRDGRLVTPMEWAWNGSHPFSGRALKGYQGAEGLPGLEPKEPVRLRVHAAECEPGNLEGADVWLWKHEEIDRRLIPVTPVGLAGAGDRPVPASVVDATFEHLSPGRPQGRGVWLGPTPIEKRSLPMGSYLLLVAQNGRVPLRVPISIPRCGHWEQEVTLFGPGEIPAEFTPIPAGPFTYQGDPGNPYADVAQTKAVDDVLIGRYPVTCREYAGFLNELSRTDPAQAALRVPRQGEDAGFYWPGPPYAVPTAAWLASASPELRARAKRLQQCPEDWEEDWPVFGVSWEDGMAYAAWKRATEGRATILPHELEWEKAARGTDRRFFPWGNQWDGRCANVNRSKQGGASPVRVREFPADESPYGIRGLAGNSRDACLNDAGLGFSSLRLFRGGFWSGSDIVCRAAGRTGYMSRSVTYAYGFRLGCVIRLSRPT
jgi:formylglycine-generating enzyme required for sulfatase activity/tRNA A-37 threonylcarbamoyl transferase component Bud32